MLYICVGDDHPLRKSKYDSLLHTMNNKRPDAQEVVLEGDESVVINQIKQHIGGIGLFDEKSIVKGFGIMEGTLVKKYVLDNIQELVGSPNAFLLSEQSLGKLEIKKFETNGGKVFVFDSPTVNNNHNLFYLGDLLLKKNKSQLWVGIQDELSRGISIEEIMGILMWQTKSLYLSKTYSQTDSGLKPFVYNKCNKSQWIH